MLHKADTRRKISWKNSPTLFSRSWHFTILKHILEFSLLKEAEQKSTMPKENARQDPAGPWSLRARNQFIQQKRVAFSPNVTGTRVSLTENMWYDNRERREIVNGMRSDLIALVKGIEEDVDSGRCYHGLLHGRRIHERMNGQARNIQAVLNEQQRQRSGEQKKCSLVVANVSMQTSHEAKQKALQNGFSTEHFARNYLSDVEMSLPTSSTSYTMSADVEMSQPDLHVPGLPTSSGTSVSPTIAPHILYSRQRLSADALVSTRSYAADLLAAPTRSSTGTTVRAFVQQGASSNNLHVQAQKSASSNIIPLPLQEGEAPKTDSRAFAA